MPRAAVLRAVGIAVAPAREGLGAAAVFALVLLGHVHDVVGTAALLRHEELRLVELQLPLITRRAIVIVFLNNYEILGFPSN